MQTAWIWLFRTAWQLYGLSHIRAFHMDLSYKPKDQSLKFWQKNIENWRLWKSQFFWVGYFEYFYNFFSSSPPKSGTNYGVESMGLNFHDNQTFLGGVYLWLVFKNLVFNQKKLILAQVQFLLIPLFPSRKP